MKQTETAITDAVLSGVKRGWSGFIWMLKILVPISFLTTLLVYSGWIGKMDFLLEPCMQILGLPPHAALPLVAGLLTGIYGGIAAMAPLALSINEMTLIAVFLLISHNLIQESYVQGKTGLNPVAAAVVRLIASVTTVFFLARILPENAAPLAAANAAASQAPGPFLATMTAWGAATFFLCLKILVIIMALMILLEVMKHLDLINRLVDLIWPLLKVMGLSRGVGFLWLTAGIFGLTYGAAVLMEEVRGNSFDEEELNRLQFSMGINHAMVEDPALFLPLGISPLWLWLPRMVAAALASHLVGAWYRFSGSKRSIPAAGPAETDV